MRAKSASIWPVRRSNSISFASLALSAREMDVNLVGTELGATLADLGEIERRRAVGDASDRENLAAGAGAAAHEHDSWRPEAAGTRAARRPCGHNGGPTHPSRNGTETLRSWRRGVTSLGVARLAILAGCELCPERGELDNTRTHT